MNAQQILALAARRRLLPTGLGTKDIRRLIAAEIRQRSVFIARGTNVSFLGDIARVVDAYIAGEIGDAEGRKRLLESLQDYGYTPEGGFAGDGSIVPPAEVGSLQDISSPQRLQLIITTQVELMFGAGQKAAGEAPDAAYTYPAWELVRVSQRVKTRKWLARWEEVGAPDPKNFGGRMIAVKGSEFWHHLGDSGFFDDALDTNHPPFAFNSGMGWRAVSRAECISLGVIAGDHKPKDFEAWRLNERMKVGAAKIPADIVKAAKKELDADLVGRELRLKRSIEAAKQAYLSKAA